MTALAAQRADRDHLSHTKPRPTRISEDVDKLAFKQKGARLGAESGLAHIPPGWRVRGPGRSGSWGPKRFPMCVNWL